MSTTMLVVVQLLAPEGGRPRGTWLRANRCAGPEHFAVEAVGDHDVIADGDA